MVVGGLGPGATETTQAINCGSSLSMGCSEIAECQVDGYEHAYGLTGGVIGDQPIVCGRDAENEDDAVPESNPVEKQQT